MRRFPTVHLGAVACAAFFPLAAQSDHGPAQAVAGLDVAEGLEAALFASEPMVLSPSNVDVDHRGRVWVCEVVNYRGYNGKRPEGDRILILEDTDQDGKADSSTVFHQGRDIDTALARSGSCPQSPANRSRLSVRHSRL
ncbi:MAG TPA: hypothetical protein VMN36_08365 [Verrucomicrobiales bacterium]|nr:hypothetical protein [Verrucomicrobiales bacterium]